MDKASELESEDLGFDPLAGQDERQFFSHSESTLLQTCLCLTSLRVCSMHSNFSSVTSCLVSLPIV